MLYDARLSQEFAAKLLDGGHLVIGFYYPVGSQRDSKDRVQISAAHEIGHLDKAVKAFEKYRRKLEFWNRKVVINHPSTSVYTPPSKKEGK